ncbi:dihydrodipicolinate synthase family protein [Acidisphaera sp. L21]|uniref:dihydrodipicolinate synthase family protein n=1 Tax=Acidisphaera sp. L21 TaxID=1641851 RepID=UPI00131DD547|nr:dihydrodipicolinate synthase family protein [Acidisphaera sp. L21]
MPALFPTGVFSAAASPVHADLTPDHTALAAHCRTLLEEGCDGIALLGTTGEANSFSGAERRAMLEAVVQSGIPPDKLLPGTGVASFIETAELTKHALSLGVTTVVMLPPYYYKNINEDGLFAAYAAIIERVADPRLRVVLYHIPMFSSVPIPIPVIARLRESFPGVFVGLKDSSGDLANMVSLVEAFPGFAVLAGADPLMLPLLRKGGAGCITATSNLVAADLALVFRHYDDATRAEAVNAAQARIVAARNRVSQFAQIPSVKTLLAQKTGRPDWAMVRPPLLPLTQAETAALLG